MEEFTPIFNTREEAIEYAKKYGLSLVQPQSFIQLTYEKYDYNSHGYNEYKDFLEEILTIIPSEIKNIKGILEDSDYLKMCEIAMKKDASVIRYIENIKKNPKLRLDENDDSEIENFDEFLEKMLLSCSERFNEIMNGINEMDNFEKMLNLYLEKILIQKKEHFKYELGDRATDEQYEEVIKFIKELIRIYTETRNETKKEINIKEFKMIYEYRTSFKYNKVLENVCQSLRYSIMLMRTKKYGEKIGTQDLELIKNIENYEGNLSIVNINYLKNFVFPKKFKGTISIYNLSTIENVSFPEEFEGNITMPTLTQIKALVLPKKMNGDINMQGLNNSFEIQEIILPLQGNGKILMQNLEIYEMSIPEEYTGKIYTKDYIFTGKQKNYYRHTRIR